MIDNTEIRRDGAEPLLLLARADRVSLAAALEKGETHRGSGDYRIAMFHPSPERVQRAIKIVLRDRPWRNKQDIWFSNEVLTQRFKTAFLYPGLDGQTGGETATVARYFGLPETPATASSSNGVLHSAVQLAQRTRVLDSAMKRSGIEPGVVAGHSVGEWLAGFAAGWAEEEDAAHLLRQQDPGVYESTDTPFLVVGCSYDQLQPFLDSLPDIHLSNDNCPQQVIVCGTNRSIEQLVMRLQEKQVFHQLLPFRSGFHTPFLEPRVSRLLDGFNKLRFRKPRVPLWSATTLQPYPDGQEGIRLLTKAHLLRPVRFRSLVEKLYEEDVRVFLQVGSGGLIGFVDDTLKGKTYSAVAANVASRSGIAQLRRVWAALFAEGKEVGELAASDVLPPLKVDHEDRVMKALLENQREMERVQTELVEVYRHYSTRPQTAGPFARELDITIDNHPYLIDHALIRQPPGWDIGDMDPVIPMTMLLEVFGDIAEDALPGKTIRTISHVEVRQWMSVATPFREHVIGEWSAPGTLKLTIEKYADAELAFTDNDELPEEKLFNIGTLLPIRIDPHRIYQEHMFHGEAYRGIKEVTAVAEQGIRGVISGGSGKGSLLDNAGQLFGLWLQLVLPQEKIAFPVRIKEVAFHGDRKKQDGLFECTCRLTQLSAEYATADFILKKDGLVWATIRGWQNRRLELDDRLWRACLDPLRHFLSEEIRPGIFLFHDAYSRPLSWDFVARRYFSQRERAHLTTLPPRKKREWIISRVAAKDAVLTLMRRTRGDNCYPVEIGIRSGEQGQPLVDSPFAAGIEVSLSHKDHMAAATAAAGPVGIDIETIVERSEEFTRLAFHPEELALIKGKDAAEWMTRCWVAKEAYGKYLGLGLQYDPLHYRITAIRGESLRIGQVEIETIHHKNHIIGWTH